MVINRACIVGAPWWLCIGCLAWLWMPLHRPAAPWLEPMSFPVRWPGNSGGQRQEEESLVGGALVGQAGHPTSQRPHVVPLAAYRLPPAIRHYVGQNNHHTFHEQCLPLHWAFHLPLSPSINGGEDCWGLRHLIDNPSEGVPDRVWALSSQPCLGLWAGLTGGAATRTLGHAPCQVKAMLGVLGGCGQTGSQTSSFAQGLCPQPRSARSADKSGLAPNSLSTSNWTCFLSFFSFCEEASHHSALSFKSWGLGLQLEAFHGVMVLLIRMGS